MANSITLRFPFHYRAKFRKQYRLLQNTEGYISPDEALSKNVESWGRFYADGIRDNVAPAYSRDELITYEVVYFSENDPAKAFKRMGFWVVGYDKETKLWEVEYSFVKMFIKIDFGERMRLKRIKTE